MAYFLLLSAQGDIWSYGIKRNHCQIFHHILSTVLYGVRSRTKLFSIGHFFRSTLSLEAVDEKTMTEKALKCSSSQNDLI